MSNRVVEYLYRLKDGTTKVLKRISRGYRENAKTAETSSQRVEAANKRHSRSVSGVLASIGKLRFAYFAVAGAVAGAVGGVARFAKAASDQENAERRLETAIRNGVGATEEQIQALKEQAKERQRVTRFGDEATLSAQAQLATFKLNADQIAQLTPRVQDLAESQRRLGRQNVDLESSAQLVGKALSGNAGELSRYGVILTDAQRETIRLGNANERVAALSEALDANFKGMATSLTTYEQASVNAKNSAGDFMEVLGSTITQNPAVTSALQSITESLDSMATAVAENSGAIKRFVTGTVAGFRILKNTADIIFDAILLGANRLNRKMLETAQSMVSNLAKFTFGSTRETLDGFVSDIDKRLGELDKASEDRFRSMGDNVAEYLEAGRNLTAALFGQAEAQEQANEATRDGTDAADDHTDSEADRAAAIERTRATLEKFGIEMEDSAATTQRSAKEMTADLLQLARDGEASLRQMAEAAKSALDEFDTEQIENFRRKLNEAFAAGEIGKDAYERLIQTVLQLKAETGDSTSEFDRLNAAIAQANGHELTNIASEVRALGEAGKLSAEEVKKLHATITAARRASTQSNQQNQQSTKDLTKAQQELGDEVEATGDGAAAVGALIADVLGQLRELSDGAAEAVNRWVESGTRTRIISKYLSEMADFSRELTAEFNSQVEQADQLAGKVSELNGYQLDLADSALKYSTAFDLLPEDKFDQLADSIRRAKEEMERFEESTREGVETLEDELLRLQGREEELEERRLERRRREIELELESNNLSKEAEENLRRQLKLLDKIGREKERQRQEDQKQQEQQNSGSSTSDSGGGTSSSSSGGQGGGTSSSSGGGGGGTSTIKIEFGGDRGDPNAPSLNPSDLAKLKRELTQAVLQEIRMQQSIGI